MGNIGKRLDMSRRPLAFAPGHLYAPLIPFSIREIQRLLYEPPSVVDESIKKAKAFRDVVDQQALGIDQLMKDLNFYHK